MNQHDNLQTEYATIRTHLIEVFKISYQMPERYHFINESDTIAFKKHSQQLALYMNEAIQINLKMLKLSNQLIDNNELKS